MLPNIMRKHPDIRVGEEAEETFREAESRKEAPLEEIEISADDTK